MTTTPDALTVPSHRSRLGNRVWLRRHMQAKLKWPRYRHASAPLQDVAEAAPNHLQRRNQPVETPRIEAASEVPVEEDTEPVVQWPIEPPVIQTPLVAAHTSASALAPAQAAASTQVATPAQAATSAEASVQAEAPAKTVTSAEAPATQYAAPVPTPTPFQIFAAQLEASDAQTDVPPFVEDEPTQTHPAAPVPTAEVVIDKPLAPWETRIDAVAPVDAEMTDTSALSDVSDASETVDVADDLNSSSASDASTVVAAVAAAKRRIARVERGSFPWLRGSGRTGDLCRHRRRSRRRAGLRTGRASGPGSTRSTRRNRYAEPPHHPNRIFCSPPRNRTLDRAHRPCGAR